MKILLLASLLSLFFASAIAQPNQSENFVFDEENGPESEEEGDYLNGDYLEPLCSGQETFFEAFEEPFAGGGIAAVEAKHPYCVCSGDLWCFIPSAGGHKNLGSKTKTYPVTSDEICSEDFCKGKLAQDAREFAEKHRDAIPFCKYHKISWKEIWK